jgi:hypothetical protein
MAPEKMAIDTTTGVILPPFTKLINKCPATMLAAKRTERVRGRIKFLTNSITTIKGIRTLGVPDGTKCARNLFIDLKAKPISTKNHTQKAIAKVNEIFLEGVKV